MDGIATCSLQLVFIPKMLQALHDSEILQERWPSWVYIIHHRDAVYRMTYMQFLAARSLWMIPSPARYSIPLATCKHIPISRFLV